MPLKLKRWHRVRISRTGLLAEVQVDDNKKVAQLATGAFTQVNNVLLFYFPPLCHAILKTSLWALFRVEKKKILSKKPFTPFFQIFGYIYVTTLLFPLF